MIISIYAEKAFDGIQHPFTIKSWEKVEIEGTLLNIIKAIYDKHTANIMFNAENLEPFPLVSGARQNCPLSPLLLNIVLDAAAPASREQKEIKIIQIGKEDIMLSLFAEDMILYIENPKDAARKQLELINEFGKVAGYKINAQTSLAFLYTNDEISESEIKKTLPFTIATERKPYLGINLPKKKKDLYAEYYMTLMKAMTAEIRLWSNIPCHWFGRIQLL